jgi:hypothetical protein
MGAPRPHGPARRRLVLVAALLAACPARAQGPSVEATIAACDRGAALGNRGVDAAACEWYTAPCACRQHGKGPEAPTWCVPDSESIDATKTKVLAELRLLPDPSRPAEEAVAEILARLYPCPAGP